MNKYVYGISASIECLDGDMVVRTNPETKILLGRRLKIGWWLMKLGMRIATGEYYDVLEEVEMPEGLTKTGYDMIVEHIINRTIQPPNDKTCFELNEWLQGYADCQNTILEIIGKMKDQISTGGNADADNR